MPNDAKLGLVVGVALVLTVAVVFFRKDASVGASADTSVRSSPEANEPPRTALARATRPSLGAPTEPTARRHTVREGETPYSLAQRYYGDGERFHLINRANQQDADATDPLTPGTVLVIPDVTTFPRPGW